MANILVSLLSIGSSLLYSPPCSPGRHTEARTLSRFRMIRGRGECRRPVTARWMPGSTAARHYAQGDALSFHHKRAQRVAKPPRPLHYITSLTITSLTRSTIPSDLWGGTPAGGTIRADFEQPARHGIGRRAARRAMLCSVRCECGILCALPPDDVAVLSQRYLIRPSGTEGLA